MTDDLLLRIAALDAPRPLPVDVVARLERVLAAEADGMGDLAVADAPRPLPDMARDRMEDTLVRVAVIRPLPSPLRNRLERTLVRREPPWRRAAVAASILCLVAATAVFVSGDGDRPGPDVATAPSIVSEASDSFGGVDAGGPVLGVDPGSGASGAAPTGLVLGTRAGGGAGFAYREYEAPPYAFAYEVLGDALSIASDGTPVELRDPPPLAPLRVGVMGGDSLQEAGFRSYVALVNERGGAGGHRIDVVDAGAPDTIATVNLSRQSVADGAGAPIGTTTPLVESVDVAEPSLRGTVFSLSSVPERQAHLAVAAAFEAGTSLTNAVIYTAGSGPFAGRIPDALERSLRVRQVNVVRVQWRSSPPVPLAPASVAFVSLPTDEARAWLQSAKAAGYAPPAGIWGIWSLADEALLADMPANVRTLSPYELVASVELRDLTARTGMPPSARLVHGWATAKWLAVSIWLSRADDNAELARALAADGFESGFSPPLDYRDETHSRLPEAVVLRPQGGRLVAEGGFRRDER